ncbi:transposase, partial [Streptomyces sp. SID13031]|uniref:transposase n=1 Tax=Streptomyces sp. SID13031 TaxID=2706046 RepID=UPI0013CA6CAA
MGKKKPRPRRSFTAEFKAEIVELCERGDRSVGQVAKDFDLTQTAVREWLKQAERDAGTGDGGVTSSERTSSRRCGGRTVGCAKTSTSWSVPRLSSRQCHDPGAWQGSLVSSLPRRSMACPRCAAPPGTQGARGCG